MLKTFFQGEEQSKEALLSPLLHYSQEIIARKIGQEKRKGIQNEKSKLLM